MDDTGYVKTREGGYELPVNEGDKHVPGLVTLRVVIVHDRGENEPGFADLSFGGGVLPCAETVQEALRALPLPDGYHVATPAEFAELQRTRNNTDKDKH